MSDASISQFDWRLVNQHRQINDYVFRLHDSSKYLTTLRSNISPCQNATTLILTPLYNIVKQQTVFFHIWMSFSTENWSTVHVIDWWTLCWYIGKSQSDFSFASSLILHSVGISHTLLPKRTRSIYEKLKVTFGTPV